MKTITTEGTEMRQEQVRAELNRFILPVLLSVVSVLSVMNPIKTVGLEIALEENRAQKGSIGFIDIRRVFEKFPETRKAKTSFEQEVRKRDAQLQAKREQVRKLRQDLARLQAEREFLSSTPIQVSTPSVPVSTGAPSGVGPDSGRGPSGGEEGSAEAAVVDLPGIGALPVVSTATPAGLKAEVLAGRLRKLDEEIEKQKALVATAERELRGLARQLEDELSKLEREKSRALLGKIYRQVQVLAREEGVSIVIDKDSILFGHDAVDLTDKLIEVLGAAQ